MAALALDEVFRIRVYNVAGRIIWSERELLGIRFPDNILAGDAWECLDQYPWVVPSPSRC